MLYSKWIECAGWKNLECLTVKQCAAGIVSFFIEVISKRLKSRPEGLFGKRGTHLQTEDDVGPTRWRRQALHHSLSRGHEQHRAFGLGQKHKDRSSSTRAFVRCLQLIEWQRIQSWKDKRIA